MHYGEFSPFANQYKSCMEILNESKNPGDNEQKKEEPEEKSQEQEEPEQEEETGDKEETDDEEEKTKETNQSVKYYTVKKGDSLLSISQKIYGKNRTKELCERNQLENEDKIYEGQKLILLDK